MDMSMRNLLGGLTITVLSLATAGNAETKITASEAIRHVGERATVCGVVASARFAEHTRGRPTFLDLDKGYPEQVFTILIWGENRGKFGAPEQELRNKRICVSGRVQEYRGKPEIIASDPSQIGQQ
jgi:micrococcal nuclease